MLCIHGAMVFLISYVYVWLLMVLALIPMCRQSIEYVLFANKISHYCRVSLVLTE